MAIKRSRAVTNLDMDLRQGASGYSAVDFQPRVANTLNRVYLRTKIEYGLTGRPLGAREPHDAATLAELVGEHVLLYKEAS